MNTGLEAHNSFSEGQTHGFEAEKAGKIFPDAYAAERFEGRGASAGRAVGSIVVVKDEKDMRRVREGSVIVTPRASRMLIGNMQKACAVITERGGIGATAFWYAREYDIPAVTGVEGIIDVVREGDLIQVDGTSGTVEILRHKVPRTHR